MEDVSTGGACGEHSSLLVPTPPTLTQRWHTLEEAGRAPQAAHVRTTAGRQGHYETPSY